MHARVPSLLRRMLSLCSLLLFLVLTGCQTQQDAVAAAQQMAATTATLQAYYASLLTLVDRNLEAQTALGVVTGVPVDSDTRRQLDDIRSSLQTREDAAAAFTRLAAKFSELTASTAQADVVKAATDLNGKVVALAPLPTGVSSAEATVLKMTVNALMTAVVARQEIKAAQQIKPATDALSALFDKEADTYVSFSNSYYNAAASASNALIQQQAVPAALLFRSSLEPFGLIADITDAQTKKAAVAHLRNMVSSRQAERAAQTRAATNDLGEALHVMRDRIDTVARHKPLHADRPPFTLEGAREWINQVRNDLGA